MGGQRGGCAARMGVGGSTSSKFEAWAGGTNAAQDTTTHNTAISSDSRRASLALPAPGLVPILTSCIAIDIIICI
eukprot:scaffold8874_cov129-Isochrysis_galbana.AAC.1